MLLAIPHNFYKELFLHEQNSEWAVDMNSEWVGVVVVL
jgi:hypothetical protein